MPNIKDDINLNEFLLDGAESETIEDLRKIDEKDKKHLLMAGIDVEEKERSGTFLHVNHSKAHCKTCVSDVEILDIKEALEKYDSLKDYYWKAVDPNTDKYTKAIYEKLHGGYFIRTKKGAKIENPVQSCLFIKGNKVGQNVHNIIIVEEDSEVHIITGCAVAHDVRAALHIGVSEVYIKKGGKLTFTMIHNWGPEVYVRPRSVIVVEEGGIFINNYILIKEAKNVQLYPTVYLNGKGAVSRSNSILVAPEGSYLNVGSRMILNAPDTRAEIISRAITTGGTVVAPGHIQANAVPAKGHLECKGLILKDGVIHAIPELEGTVAGVELSHEAAVGKVAQEEIEYLMARGLDEEEATSTIVRGFLNVDIMGLPPQLQHAVDEIIEEASEDMF